MRLKNHLLQSLLMVASFVDLSLIYTTLPNPALFTLPTNPATYTKMSDPMERAMDLEDALHREGFEEGWQKGLEEANKEGVQMGAEVGCVAGMRIGYVRGYMAVLEKVKGKVITTDRQERSFQAVKDTLAEIDMNKLDEDIIRQLETRFTLLSKQLKLDPKGTSTASLLPSNMTLVPDTSF